MTKPNLKQLEKQVNDLTEALQRERADSMNIRRRADEERGQIGNTVKAMVLESLLPALDNLDRALAHVPKELKDSEYVKGVQGVAKQFEQCFAELGVERIKTVGEIFDPKLHEAIHLEEGKGSVEVVCEELQPGYKIGDDVIRHAKVNVRMEKK